MMTVRSTSPSSSVTKVSEVTFNTTSQLIRLIRYSLLSLLGICSLLLPIKLLSLTYLIIYWHLIKYSLLGLVGLGLVKKMRGWRNLVRFRNKWYILGLIGGVVGLTWYDSLGWMRGGYQPTALFVPNNNTSSSSSPFYFIAGNLFNNEPILPHYIQQVNQFIDRVGPNNVFISIIEDHSQDNTREILLTWKTQLKLSRVPHRIITDFKMPPPASVDRIQKMAYLRNAALQPYFQLNLPLPPNSKVIFLNDILFFTQDLITLLNTDGGDYDITCGTDYDGVGMYDIWVLRDRLGHITSSVDPIFTRVEDQKRWLGLKPVSVYSCWNGVIVFNSNIIEHYFSSQLVTNTPFTNLSLFQPSPPSPTSTINPDGVRFRSQTYPNECYSSECLLIFKDLRQLYPQLSVKINPLVKVGYQFRYYFLWKEVLNWHLIRLLLHNFLPLEFQRPLPIPHRDDGLYQCY